MFTAFFCFAAVFWYIPETAQTRLSVLYHHPVRICLFLQGIFICLGPGNPLKIQYYPYQSLFAPPREATASRGGSLGLC